MTVDSNPTSSYQDYLPAILLETPFLGRFLLAFEHVLTSPIETDIEPRRGLEDAVASVPDLFDPQKAPKEFLTWLAGWVGLSLRADWTEEQQRDFLAQIVLLYNARGTKNNLAQLLKIYTGLEPVIVDGEGDVFQIGVHSTIGADTRINGRPPHYFHVTVSLPEPDPAMAKRQLQVVRALIELQKPAHTRYELEVVHETMQIGVRSTIGVDTLLGTLPA